MFTESLTKNVSAAVGENNVTTGGSVSCFLQATKQPISINAKQSFFILKYRVKVN
jgi:hypothetical protein